MRKVIVLLCGLMCFASSIVCPATNRADADKKLSVLWVRPKDQSLWMMRLSGKQTPIKLFGHWVTNEDIHLSPDGRYALVYDMVYDLTKPGVRRNLPKLRDKKECYLNEWTPDSKAILLARYADPYAGENLGVYAVALGGGKRRLMAQPARKGMEWATHACYSPDGRFLAVEGEVWLQIVETQSGKTVVYREFSDGLAFLDASGNLRDWASESRFVFIRTDGLWIADAKTHQVRRLIKGVRAVDLLTAPKDGAIYVGLVTSQSSDSLAYSVDPDSGAYKRLVFTGFTAAYPLGVTSNGEEFLVSGDRPKEPGGLYLVDKSGRELYAIPVNDWSNPALAEPQALTR